MKSLKDLLDLKNQIKEEMDLNNSSYKYKIVIGMATCGIASGAAEVMNTIKSEIEKRNLKNIRINKTGCIGVCSAEPIVEIFTQNDRTIYVNITPEKIIKILDEHILNGKIIEEYTLSYFENNKVRSK